jgi:hypothetical protein
MAIKSNVRPLFHAPGSFRPTLAAVTAPSIHEIGSFHAGGQVAAIVSRLSTFRRASTGYEASRGRPLQSLLGKKLGLGWERSRPFSVVAL